MGLRQAFAYHEKQFHQLFLNPEGPATAGGKALMSQSCEWRSARASPKVMLIPHTTSNSEGKKKKHQRENVSEIGCKLLRISLEYLIRHADRKLYNHSIFNN